MINIPIFPNTLPSLWECFFWLLLPCMIVVEPLWSTIRTTFLSKLMVSSALLFPLSRWPSPVRCVSSALFWMGLSTKTQHSRRSTPRGSSARYTGGTFLPRSHQGQVLFLSKFYWCFSWNEIVTLTCLAEQLLVVGLVRHRAELKKTRQSGIATATYKRVSLTTDRTVGNARVTLLRTLDSKSDSKP